MSLYRQFLAVCVVLGIGLLYHRINTILGPVPAPKLRLDQWWGDGDKPKDWNAYVVNTSEIIGNRLSFSEIVIDELRTELNRSLRTTEPLEGVAFEYGFNSRYLKELIAYWRDDYLPRWREREVFLWQFNHFTTDIQGLRMHFLNLMVYDESKVGKTHYPVLLLHGWPSSVREFYPLIHNLHQTRNHLNSTYIFDVIVPSLPGYAWSEGTSKPGMGPARVAVIMRNLMLRLGHKRFFIHGSDWGGVIGSHMATLFPENVIGYHSNTCHNMAPKSILKGIVANAFPMLFVPKGFGDFFSSLSTSWNYFLEESGYYHIHATKPDTIGAALTQNPIGLAVYILEKFSTWTNPEYRHLENGGLRKHFKLDALLDNVMIYHLTRSITTSQRLFAENYSNQEMSLNLERVPTEVPTGCARFKHDFPYLQQLDFQLKDKYVNLIHSTYYKEGGHFAALELPNVVHQDFTEFVRKVEKFTKGK